MNLYLLLGSLLVTVGLIWYTSLRGLEIEKMKAIRVQKFGGPDVLQLADVEEPKPGPGQARVKIHAAGLNFIDIYQRRGDYPVQLPWTPGLEGAGVVDAVGDGVTSVKPGDRVAYTSQPGSYAEATLTKADMLVQIPPEVSFEEGAAFPLQGMTAHYLLHEFRPIKPGDVVLIHAAAGGMGLLLVQWAKHMGAKVIGTTSSEEKARIATESGADHVILYTKQDFVTEVKKLTADEGAQLIIDGVGKTTFTKNLDAAALRGTVVIYGSASGPAEPIAPNLLQKRSLTVCGGSLFNYLLNREELLRRSGDVLKGLREGWLKFRIDQVLPLAEAGKAQTILESRQSIGKLLLKTS
jgi:NADPH2:quinone reductase